MDRTARRLVQGGIFGAGLFVVVAAMLASTRPGYDSIRHFVSILSLGEGGALQIANFVVSGLLVAGLGVGLRRHRDDGSGSRWIPTLVIVAGLALAWCGIFTPDPSNGYPPGTPDALMPEITWHGALHLAGTVTIGVAIALGAALSARTWWAAGRKSLVVTETLLAAVVAGSLLWVLVSGGLAGVAETVGLLERIAVLAGFAWFVLLGVVELRSPPSDAAVATAHPAAT